MSSDFGGPRRRRSSPAVLVVAVLLGVAAAGAGAYWIIQQRARSDETVAWKLKGPPCEVADKSAYAVMAGSEPLQASEVKGATLSRSTGRVVCGNAPDPVSHGAATIPACQFDVPTALDVQIGARHFYYLPRSEPATVSIRDGQPSCVLTWARPKGWIWGQGS